jgi:hypothetical protein
MRSEKLFELLDDSGATSLTMVPRDRDSKSLGVIVVVAESAMDEFLAMLEEHWTPKKQPDTYGWDDV